jgi:CheY-like chemotaxis protein
MSSRVLLADDQADVLEAFRLLLKAQGYETEAVSSPAGLLEAVEAREFDAVLMDLNYARDTSIASKTFRPDRTTSSVSSARVSINRSTSGKCRCVSGV